MAADDAGTEETAVLVAVEGKRLNAEDILNSWVVSHTVKGYDQ
jgi:hypothetical protein